MKCVSKGYNSIYFDTKHLDSNQPSIPDNLQNKKAPIQAL
jgi:hypothetical protein